MPREDRADRFIVSGALLAGLGIALGAFGAHGLTSILDSRGLEIFETAVRYQIYHSVGILLIGVMLHASRELPASARTWLIRAGWLMLAGILVFSGSLYLLVATDTGWLGAITPLGGLCFISGWMCLAVGGLKTRRLPRTGG